MPFSCTRSKAKDEIYRNNNLEKRINETSSDHMELNNMRLTDEDIPFVIRKVIKKRRYTSLSLAANELTANGIRMLVDSLQKNKRITHLILSSNPLGDESIKYIVELLRNSETLYQLSLNETMITDEGLKMLTDVLQSTASSLRCLDLRSNTFITDVSVEYLLQMADTNQTLSACRIDNCGLTQEGKEKLREAKSIRW